MAVTLEELVRLRPGVWLETYGYIRDTSGKLVRPRLNVLQRRIEAAYCAALMAGRPFRSVGVKPRKRGFSTMVGAIQYSQLQNFPHEGVIIGNKFDTSNIVFRMMVNYAESDEFKGKWGSGYHDTSEVIRWEHGALLQQATAKDKGSARGMTPQFIHGTEVAFWENAEEVMDALLNAIPDEGFNAVFLESTPYGVEGAFAGKWNAGRWPIAEECPDGKLYWKQWESLCPDQPPDDSGLAQFDFVRIFAAWYEFEESRVRLTEDQKKHIQDTLDSESYYRGERQLIELYGNEGPCGLRLGEEVENADVWEQLAWRRATIKNKCRASSRIFDEEYPRDPKTCFLASGKQVFDEDSLAHLQVMAKRQPIQHGQLTESPAGAVWTPSTPEAAAFWRWEQPKKGCHYLITADLAEGEDQTKGDDPDRHSLIVLRKSYCDENKVIHPMKVAARVRPPSRVPIYVLAKLANLLSLYYGRAIVIPEMNNSGLAFITAARLLGVPIWQRVEMDPNNGRETRRDGFRTTDNAEYGGLRATIIWHLHKVLRELGLDCPCPHIHSELVNFVDKHGRMEAGSGHDDDVMSLAIGVFNIDAATLYSEAVRVTPLPRELQILENEGRLVGRGKAMRW